jgi:hypothetical protein
MAVDEQYLRIRRSLEEKLGVEAAFYLMDRPAGGWSALVTNETLDLKLDALRHELKSDLDALRHELKSDIEDARHELKSDLLELRVELHQSIRQQTWAVMTTLLAALALFATIFGLLARG